MSNLPPESPPQEVMSTHGTTQVGGSTSGATSKRRWYPTTLRARLRVVGIAVLVLFLLSLALAKHTPGWYRPLDANDQAVIDEADRFQLLAIRLHNALGRVPLGDQTFDVTQNEVNAMLAIRYSQMQQEAESAAGANRPLLRNPMVVFSPGEVTLAADASNVPVFGSGILSVTGHAEITDSPVKASDAYPWCRLVLDSIHVGSMRVPQAVARERIAAAITALAPAIERTLTLYKGNSNTTEREVDVRTILKAVANGQAFAIPHTYEKRDIYLKAIQVSDGKLSITFSPKPR